MIRFVSIEQLRENVGIAADALRTNKLRSSLTILGVVIGVATVMTMATIVKGIRDQILTTISVAGPTTFYVMKIFSTTPLNPDQLPKYVRIRPDLRAEEATRIAAIPEVAYSGIWTQIQARISYAGTRTRDVVVFGADDRYQEINGGELTAGRWFTKSELRSGAAVAVLQERHARQVFGRIEPLEKLVQIGGRPVQVVGLYQEPENIFAAPGQEIGAIVPFQFAWHAYNIDRTNALFIVVKPRRGVTVSDAEDLVTIALREMRGLRPGDKNNFDH